MKKEIKNVFECESALELTNEIANFVTALPVGERLVGIDAKLAYKRDGGTIYVGTITTFVGELPTPGCE